MVIDKNAVGKRLKAIRLTAGTDRKEFVGRIAVAIADWNSYEDARMLITAHVAAKVVDQIPGLTLDWIFLGRTNGLDPDLHAKLLAAKDDAGKAA
jgi:hypothetical protein